VSKIELTLYKKERKIIMMIMIIIAAGKEMLGP